MKKNAAVIFSPQKVDDRTHYYEPGQDLGPSWSRFLTQARVQNARLQTRDNFFIKCICRERVRVCVSVKGEWGRGGAAVRIDPFAQSAFTGVIKVKAILVRDSHTHHVE